MFSWIEGKLGKIFFAKVLVFASVSFFACFALPHYFVRIAPFLIGASKTAAASSDIEKEYFIIPALLLNALLFFLAGKISRRKKILVLRFLYDMSYPNRKSKQRALN